ncbi:hypothetical protein [[Flexibacter] sp. ATCC 35208]|uniref:hypothetical protein n=1 Tax=[Flexibacter] sp. ATCC 35208 TaxID=1936242 RepID=UPI0009C4BBB4|nr:hypothetical protein [[Flexibacter] sp. ATCC 35208]OMP78757.1 hypothetical protein BW716_12605 [[Flexibacter] sp. ATCC 35208]
MKKKYLAFVFVMATFVACKKEANNPDPQTSNSSTIATLESNFNIANPTKEGLVSIIKFLDKASVDERNKLLKNIYPTTETKTNSKTASTESYSAYDMAGTMYPLENPNFDLDAYYETGYGPYGFSFIYTWTVLKSAISAYIVQAKERCEIADSGPVYDNLTRYTFQSIVHQGSAIVGVTFGTGWAETASDIYMGVHNAYSTVHGNLQGIGFVLPKEGTRVFNVGAVMASNGVSAM